ncbi:MAG TPA: ABC transporter permease [Candidatus Limiplasma sp.]|nr:ABC transporter permease [Candidatus Limiplasma sp.]
MTDIVQIKLWQFALIYLLLLVVISVMRFGKINKTRSVLWASVRMSLQLTLAGLILTYIFQNPHPLFIVVYLAGMIAFAIFRVFSINKRLNPRFRLIVAASIAFSGLMVTAYFVWLVVGESLGNPRYVIPIAGMVMGNTMTGVSLGLKTFYQLLEDQTVRIETLQNMGVKPDKLFLPLVRQAMETAILPTINSMLGTGIVSLPGMMTGQILSGTLPMTAILYQIAIMIAICTTVCLSTFASLYFGYRTLYNKRSQIQIGSAV